MNARTGGNTRQLRKVEVPPIGAGGILSLMRVATVVSVGCLRHGRVHVWILRVHAVIKDHALVEASIGRVVVPIVVLMMSVSILIIV